MVFLAPDSCLHESDRPQESTDYALQEHSTIIDIKFTKRPDSIKLWTFLLNNFDKTTSQKYSISCAIKS